MTWRHPRKRAVILAETLAAGTLLVVGMILTMQLLRWTADERRTAERRGWALQEAANTMERLTALPFESLTSESAQSAATLSPSAKEALPGGRIAVEVSPVEGIPMKRIRLEVRYRGLSGREDSPVRLAAWVSRKGGTR